jgi:predicted nucleic acid-binding protein
MSVLLDTNILTRLAEPGSSHAPLAASSVSLLIARGEGLHVVPQNLYEFWVVATRPVTDNGLGMTPAQAKLKLDAIYATTTFLPDNAAVTREWERLILLYDVKGRPAHDARLVAAMNVHGLNRILTFNRQDFARYHAITILDPATVVQQLRP